MSTYYKLIESKMYIKYIYMRKKVIRDHLLHQQHTIIKKSTISDKTINIKINI